VDELKAAMSEEVQRHQSYRQSGDGRSPPRPRAPLADPLPAERHPHGVEGSAGAAGSMVGGLGDRLAGVGVGEPSGAAGEEGAGGEGGAGAHAAGAARLASEGGAGRAAAEGMARPGVDWRSERLSDEAGPPASGRDSCETPEWYIKVLAPRLVLIRLQLQMMEPSTHALMKRLLFSPRRAAASFWAYTFTEDDVSLIIDEVSARKHSLPAWGVAQASPCTQLPSTWGAPCIGGVAAKGCAGDCAELGRREAKHGDPSRGTVLGCIG
jgi:hypothetical protein